MPFSHIEDPCIAEVIATDRPERIINLLKALHALKLQFVFHDRNRFGFDVVEREGG